MPTYFCDSLKDVSIPNGVARLEFQRLEAAPGGENRELRMMAEFVVAIPTQGLAQTMTLLDGVRERLVREGIFKTGAAEAREGGAPDAARRALAKFLRLRTRRPATRSPPAFALGARLLSPPATRCIDKPPSPLCEGSR